MPRRAAAIGSSWRVTVTSDRRGGPVEVAGGSVVLATGHAAAGLHQGWRVARDRKMDIVHMTTVARVASRAARDTR